MTEVKEVITILCKCLHDTVDSPLTPEHFRCAKYDERDKEVINALWTTLDKLLHVALKELNDEIHFCNFDNITSTKLRMAYLQYPALEFYSLSDAANDYGSRILLVALAWLITKYDVLKDVVRLKLVNSALGREFSKVHLDADEESNDANLSTVENQVNSVLSKSHKLGCNLKAISELQIEKTKLTTKVHAASLIASGLPHLSVSEMALVKKLVTNQTTKKDLKQYKELEKTASMLDSYVKWTKKNHIFYTWTNTVMDEYEKKAESRDTNETITEISKFICILRYVIKKRLKSFKKKNDSSAPLMPSCSSRFIRELKGPTEIQVCLAGKKTEFDSVDNLLEKKKTHLNNELQGILDLLPNCVQI